VVVFNEIMYHPLTNEPALEWVELYNQMAVDVDISGWKLDDGIQFNFPEGTIVPGGGYLVVAISPSALGMGLGPIIGRLSNAGEQLELRDKNNRVMDRITYGVEGDWPAAPDGSGASLAKRSPFAASANSENWSASAQIGGTPGRENFPSTPPPIIETTVVGLEGAWKFNDTGTDLGTAWREREFDDNAWPTGSGLFFKEDAPLPAPENTPLTPGRATYYFRAEFNFSGDASSSQLRIRPVIDDGAVVYLNGVEIARLNMPAGPIAYSTPANATVADATLSDVIRLPAQHLISGQNVLAVEVHQASLLSPYPQAVLNSGPMGYWRLAESSGSALDSAAAAAPPQLGPQNGTYFGLAATNLAQPGPRPSDLVNGLPLAGFEANNFAARFAGNNDGGDDAVRLPYGTTFKFSSARVFSLEAWVNGPAAQEAGAGIIAKGMGGGGEEFAIDIPGGTYRFFNWDAGQNAVIAQSGIALNGTWQHVVAVYDQPAGRMQLYVNGALAASATPRPTLISSFDEVTIGARKNSGSPYNDLNFNGRIDEVAIYDRALSTNEIFAHFNAAFDATAPSGSDTNDVVFGAEIVTAETLPRPEPLKLAFNEYASSTNSAFWIEIINYGSNTAFLTDCVIARFGGQTNREFTLPPQTLDAGALLQVTKATLGFGADSGDLLVLYGPGKTNVLDAFVAKKDPRARYPDATGPWWFPAEPSPGASNIFVFRDEVVMNEIMFHPRPLAPTPSVNSPTNMLLTISNAWKYNAQGVDLGTAWRALDYDDSGWVSSNAVFYAPTNFFTLPAPKNTFVRLTNSSGQRIITFYFRSQFIFDGDTNGLRLGLRAIIDDGAVFYLNGAEVLRWGMPGGNITYSNLATTNVPIPGFIGPFVIAPTNVVAGVNVLAVEVHQVAALSSDMDFGAELVAWNELVPALPFRDSPEAWVELYNRSSHAVDLTGWRLDEGIDYRFAAGKTLLPGAYLVVAKDVDYLRSFYPSIDIVGPFTNRLSSKSDFIALKDANNNPADEVRYFDGGRWPEYTDGAGSSLELRDPRADNSIPEAWAASDERAKSSWQTYTYRGVARTAIPGSPATWNELVLGLVEGPGEVLLDDISVIESPTNSPVQFVQNGGFDSASDHWRFLGNHGHSRVEPDPDNPVNQVLHLIATGPTEYQGNQVETTYPTGRTVVDGRTYEISFRAKCLAGASQLNTRLYFTRLAQTTQLAVPPLNGTPGGQNSVFSANIGPLYEQLVHYPIVPDPDEPIDISVLASDPDGISSMTLHYSIDSGPWQNTPMSGNSLYRTLLPPQPAGTLIHFYVEGTDTLGATSVFPPKGPDSRALLRVNDYLAVEGPLQNFRLLMLREDTDFLHAATNVLGNERLGATVIYNEFATASVPASLTVFYDVAVRLKGSFVGRDVGRVGFNISFHSEQLFRGVHDKVAVDRSQHAIIGQGEMISKHVANHAGGIPGMHDDLIHFIAPRARDTSKAQLRMAAFDELYLDSQFDNGSDGSMYEFEVFRFSSTTAGGGVEGIKLPGPGYVNLDMADYGDDKEAYRWLFLLVNNRARDDYSRIIPVAKAFSLTATNLDLRTQELMDVDEWMRAFAYESLLGVGDAYFTGGNHHNLRLYVRPDDEKVLAMPWDWDSSFFNAPTAPLVGGANLAKIVNLPNNLRAYYRHLYELIRTTYNSAHLARWTQHYGALAEQDFTGILNYIQARANFVMSQLPTNTAFAITSNGGNNFSSGTNVVTLSGTAPIQVKTIDVNGAPYALVWTSLTAWTLRLALDAPTNQLTLRGLDSFGNLVSNTLDTITVVVTNPLPRPAIVFINEWMAANNRNSGVADPADGDFEDWFELYNAAPDVVDLAGYYLTDELTNRFKFQIPPGYSIASGGFLLVWADDEETQNSSNRIDLHTGFKLDQQGEAIGLFRPDGSLMDSVIFTNQIVNMSRGRYPDAASSLYFMPTPTPRAPNQIPESTAPVFVAILIWQTTPGRQYRLEYKDDLSAPAWEPLGSAQVALETTLTIIDNTEAITQRFYRVVQVE
jgi:hypothetical protein